jgi:hypothetical protein
MPELDNSARSSLRATYTRIALRSAHPSRPGQAWAKHSFVAGLQATSDEFNRLLGRVKIAPNVRHAVETVINAKIGAAQLDNVPLFADIEWESLAHVGKALEQLREEDLDLGRDTWAEIVRMHRAPGEARARPLGRSVSSAMPSRIAPASNLELRDGLEWAIANGVRAADAHAMLNRVLADPAARMLTKASEYESLVVMRLDRMRNLIAASKQQATIAPVGMLHLERLTFVPAGIERGELVYTVPLSPGEEVNIAHKEWTTTSEEFSSIVTDFLEAYSEEGVTEKQELAQSTSSQEQHSSGFNTGVTAAGGFGGVNISSTVSYSVADAVTSSEQFARNQSSSMTRKASARSKKEHKVTFKVASALGTEEQQVRRIKNPFSDKATRVDYYQLVRKWRVDLYRYGLRLTYDVMIPEPGAGILSKIQEIQRISAALEQGFKFDLVPSDITRAGWKAGGFPEVNDVPPEGDITFEVASTNNKVSDEIDDNLRFHRITIEIPEGYEIDGAFDKHEEPATFAGQDLETQKPQFGYETKNSWHDSVPPNLSSMSGTVSVVVSTQYVRAFVVTLYVKAKLTQTGYASWQMKAWNILHDAAKARYEESRQNLKQQLSNLLEQVGAQDALSLRKIEREEVMKSVLRWMLGANFDFVAQFGGITVSESIFRISDIPVLPPSVNGLVLLPGVMEEVSAFGELIKFLHHAIEWENILYFLYPYFWSHPSRWELKKYLNHPDPMHRAFLKSGSARVVLTIRPGFEIDFMSLLEAGKLGNTHEYLTIAQEMEAYAKTNYPASNLQIQWRTHGPS